MSTNIITERWAVTSLTPEEIYEALAEKSAYFDADYDCIVYLVWKRPETKDEVRNREAAEEQERLRREEARRLALLSKEERRREKNRVRDLFLNWRKSHPKWPRYRELKRIENTCPDGLTEEEQIERLELWDLFYSERARMNFRKFVSPQG